MAIAKKRQPRASIMAEAFIRHQIHILGFETHVSKNFDSFMSVMAKDIRKRLDGNVLTEYSEERMKTLLERVNDDLSKRMGLHHANWRNEIIEFAKYEAEFTGKTIGAFVDVDYKLPPTGQLRAAVLSTPLTSLSAQGVPNLNGFYRDWRNQTIKHVDGIIRRGYYMGMPTPNIVSEIIGTKKNAFRDGEFARVKRHMTTITRTAVQHAATVARMETIQANDDIIDGVQWVSTLDSRTSDICMGLDGEIFKLDSHYPKPPAHPNCRSTLVPVLCKEFADLEKGATRIAKGEKGTEIVSANQTYYEWLKTQPQEFQDSVIGPTRGKLLREGGLSVEQFKRLSLDRNFQPRTLAEMREMEPLAFEGISFAGGALDPDSDRAEAHAARYYEAVRKNKNDAETIAKNTGFSVEDIKNVKDHLFLAKHDLGKAEPIRFHPNYEIAQSWQRLIDGRNIEPHDIILLRHELAERDYMLKGMSQDAAHKKAEELYHYAIELLKRGKK